MPYRMGSTLGRAGVAGDELRLAANMVLPARLARMPFRYLSALLRMRSPRQIDPRGCGRAGEDQLGANPCRNNCNYVSKSCNAFRPIISKHWHQRQQCLNGQAV